MTDAAFGTAQRHLYRLFASGPVAGLDDGRLLDRYARSGDPAAFEALVSRHGPMVLATCRAVLGREHDAEDAFQATFLVLARKAHTVRAGDALGGWLHRVARRASVQASLGAKRRGRVEAEAARAREGQGTHQRELAALVHEEIDRLPDRHRLPVVLCDLEGLSYDEAASQLGWTVPKLRHHLSEGRRRLKGRLKGRDVWAGTGLVPASLARSAVAWASGGTPPSGVAALARMVIGGMRLAALKGASAVALAGLALASAGVGALAGGRPAEPTPAMAPAPRAQAPTPTPTPKPDEAKGEVIELRGTVVGPDGRPVSGARVWVEWYFNDDAPNLDATTDAAGRYWIGFPRSARSRVRPDLVDRYPRVIATAPGFAPGWVAGVFRPDAPASERVVLPPLGPAIEGRVVDLEGRPIAGARVVSKNLWSPDQGDLAAWIVRIKNGGSRGIWREMTNLSLEPTPAATTGPDGRFTLEGPGVGRVAGLLLTGPAITTETVYVLGENLAEVRTIEKSMMEPRPFVVHPPRFTLAAAPSKPVEGAVIDVANGQPIAGVRIKGNLDRESDHTMIDGVETFSDDRGHYRLTGLPPADGYRLFAFPKRGTPYPNASVVVRADTPGLDPVPFDFKLGRGVLVRGRLTDKATGKPVSGRVHSFTFADNPHIKDFPGYRDGYGPDVPVGADGRFTVVALPGRSIIAATADSDRYRSGVGAESIQGARAQFGPESSPFDTVPDRCEPRWFQVLRGVDLPPGAESAEVDLPFDTGRSIMITAVDPEGHPLGGVRVEGSSDRRYGSLESASATFEVRALEPNRPRRVTITHVARKLVGSVCLEGTEAGPLTVKLGPWGSLAGRVVDDDGRPRRGLSVFSTSDPVEANPRENAALPGMGRNGELVTDPDGRFRVEGLVPGLKYGAIGADGSRGVGILFKDLVFAPGEAKDLGDFQPRPFKP
jgi:RNA polymerase sigma factor (sigma-70 family)